MVAYLTKSDASEGFNQVIDFLNGSYIKYALTINPNIYVSCIKQFWNTVSIKQVNDVTRLQALVDKKKVVVTEATIREVLRLDDAKGVDCLPNEEIFTELARMGYEKPSTKLTFYKAFFSSQWKFLIHTILLSMSAKQTSWNEFSSAVASAVICLSTCRKFNFSKYIFDSLVRNVDSTSKFYMYPCFLQLLIRKQVGDLSTHTTKYTSPTLTQKDKRLKRNEMKKSMLKMLLLVMMLKETILLLHLLHHHNYLKISHPHPRVEHLEYDKVAQALEITKLKIRVKKLKKGNRVRVLKLRKLKRVGTSQRINTSDDTVMDDESNQGRIIDEMDKDDAEDEPAKVQEVVDVVTTAKLITKVVTAASETVTAANTIISTAEPQVPTATITAVPTRVAAAPSRRRKGVTKEQMKEQENRALQSINETPIVPDEDDDVYTEATPLVRKVPVVDYEIIELNNKPYYKIIRADGTHQLYISFLTLLKNFDREDLEALWSLVKERLKSGKIKGLYMVKQRSRAGSYWNHVYCQAKLLLLDNAAEARLMLLSHVNDAKVKLVLSRQS
nr:hypothetical protein [Tanacetum cinerariifolium]